jgi:hypothetical protein
MFLVEYVLGVDIELRLKILVRKKRIIQMTVEDLKYGDKVIDNKTGEEYKFAQMQFPNALVFDEKGRTVWIPPERIINE